MRRGKAKQDPNRPICERAYLNAFVTGPKNGLEAFGQRNGRGTGKTKRGGGKGGREEMRLSGRGPECRMWVFQYRTGSYEGEKD